MWLMYTTYGYTYPQRIWWDREKLWEHLLSSLHKEKGVIILSTERKSIPLKCGCLWEEKVIGNWWLSSKNIRLTWNKAKYSRRIFSLHTIDYTVVTISLYYFEFQVLWTFCLYLILQIVFIVCRYGMPKAPQGSMLKVGWFVFAVSKYVLSTFLLRTLFLKNEETIFHSNKDQHFKINTDVICFLICTPYFDFTSCPYSVFCNKRKSPFTCCIHLSSLFISFNLEQFLCLFYPWSLVDHKPVILYNVP